VLRCPKCGWTRSADVGLRRDGFHCRNCQAIVEVVDLDVKDLGKPPP
jgi:tRNA(Ile2) C34 agmatinyltransferase TiaS